MLTDNLYEKALVDPIIQGADRLCVVSGYATANMASSHIYDIEKRKYSINGIDLVVGMCPWDGLSESIHQGFLSLTSNSQRIDFTCSYVYKKPAIHSKLYIWLKADHPFIAFTGSANYTQYSFRSRREILTECDPSAAYNYFNDILSDTIYCTHPEVSENIILHSGKLYVSKEGEESSELSLDKDTILSSVSDHIKLSLLQNISRIPNSEVGTRSGLNWGQRNGREPNQAYIPLPSNIAKTGFFPLGRTHFTVVTDDGKSLIMRVEQQNNKAITTPHNNSLLGEYFRYRLGLGNGSPISRRDLENYGRTDVDFYKIDEEQFYMDFSI